VFDDSFPGPVLDESVWTPSYLPAWSSRADADASYRIDGDGLRLGIPADHPLWCADLHEPPLRVSAVQSGNWSGPVGSAHRSSQSPDYPMLLIIGLFDFPDGTAEAPPELVVRRVRGT
jgi:hypothetical protein